VMNWNQCHVGFLYPFLVKNTLKPSVFT
jgi:hypothetical protein